MLIEISRVIDEKSSYKLVFENALLKSYKRSKIHKQSCSYNTGFMTDRNRGALGIY